MDTTKIWMHGFEINIRTATGYQDVGVISECLGGDCYSLKELSVKLIPEVVLDIGGHIGAFGLCVKKIWPNTKLIAVEPCKESYELYCMNMKDNGIEATVINKAISYNPNRTRLLPASRTSGGGVVLSDKEIKEYGLYRMYSSDTAEDVETTTIDELIKDYDKIDLAKFDCEGGEIDAFRKMSDKTASKLRTIVGEYHLWGDGKRILQASPLDEMAFWVDVKRKLPHLLWSWTGTAGDDDKYGRFQAWPKAS